VKVALVFPPQGHFTQPYLSLPSLGAYLKANGVPDVTLIDANIEAYDRFLSPARLRRSLDAVRAGEGLASLDARDALRFSEMERYQLLSEIDLIGDEVAERIEEAKAVLRSPREFYDYERYLWAGRTLEQGLRIFSAEYAPTRLTAHGFMMRRRIERTSDILAAIDDERENPFVSDMREHVLPQLKALDPDLVGLSVTFPSQAIPAFTLAAQIKAWKPECHITIGGGLLAYVADKLSRRAEVWSAIDSMVLLEGEGPLLQLCETLDGDGDLSAVSNLVWCERPADARLEGNVSERVRVNSQDQPLDIKTLPTPDFDGMPLEKYFSPELVLPLAATRGCYWGKCVFCTLYTVIGPGYRGRTIEQTVADMAALQRKHGTKHFYLAIEDLPPNMARAMPRAILDAGLDVDWWCDARLEAEVFTQEVCDDLAASGCKRIAFGFESSSRRVLDAMCKGIDPDLSIDLIRRVREAGISVTLYVMVGFPTETLEEARQTLATIVEHKQLVQEVSVRVFYLDERSEIFSRREEFDILEIYPDPQADLQVYYDFRTGSGMTRQEARDVYLEFTRALRSHFPVFQNTNMLYHELKSHYFLYLAKWGSWEALCAEVLERTGGAGRVGEDGGTDATPAEPEADSAWRPRRSARLRQRALAFDREALDARLASIDSHKLRPRYQSDLIEDEDRARLDVELPPLPPEASVLVHDGGTGEVHALSPAAAELLMQCDGTRPLTGLLADVPQAAHADARACLAAMVRAGLLSPPAVARPTLELKP
jgi:radical SAM superfamily enzyme YgiQ (UPF0313 family)